MEKLEEKKRRELVNQSKSGRDYASKEGNRFKRRLKCSLPSNSSAYENIDMNKLFKKDILEAKIQVKGETDTYEVIISFGDVLYELKRVLKERNCPLKLNIILRAVIRAFDRNDVYIHCNCLHPSTQIKLLDGTAPTVAEMCSRYEAGEKLYVYSVDEKGDFVPGEVEKVWITRNASEFIKVVLDNGEEVITTPEHPYMLRNGEYELASNLKVGDSLMPLYFQSSNGYETIHYNSKKGLQSTYKLVAAYYKQPEIDEADARADDSMKYRVAVHHKDFNKSNNTPENLQIMTAKEHWMYHANLAGDNKVISEEARKRLSDLAKERNANPTDRMLECRKTFIAKGAARNYDADRKQQQSILMKEVIANYYSNLTPEEKQRKSLAQSKKSKELWKQGAYDTDKFKQASHKRGDFLRSKEIEQKAKEGVQRYWDNLPEEERNNRIAVSSANLKKAQDKVRGSKCSEETKDKMRLARINESPEALQQRIRQCDFTKIYKVLRSIIDDKADLTLAEYNSRRKFAPKLTKWFSGIEDAVAHFQLNHKVQKIEHIFLEDTPVYDIKVKEHPNFLVNAGVILHNCPDFKYRFNYWATIDRYNAGDPEMRPTDETNPEGDLGSCCKHGLLVLNKQIWIIKVASVINNYIRYMRLRNPRMYEKFIAPAIFDKGEEPIEEPKETGRDPRQISFFDDNAEEEETPEQTVDNKVEQGDEEEVEDDETNS